MICPVCKEEIYNTYECSNCGHDCEDDLPDQGEADQEAKPS